jgi:carbon-monoxide dehydrogenase small subunit
MSTPDRLDLTLRLNGRPIGVTVDGDATLVDVLREDLGVTGARIGCRNGDCGVCTALVDDRCVKTCLVLAARADGATVETLEGLGDEDDPTPVQQAFMECYAFQCGFCLPGMVFAATALLDRDPAPDDARIRDALSGNLCRCTGYHNLVRAVHRAAELRRAREGTGS